jgi:hypothetical protein
VASCYRDLCNEILSLDGIASTTILSMEGNILYSARKDGAELLLSRHEAEAFIFRAAIRMGTRKEFLEKLGGINYAFAEYGKVNQYTIPLDREVKTLLLVCEDKKKNHNSCSIASTVEINKSTTVPIITRIMAILTKHGAR